jgi:hypothetical protein
VTPQVRHGITRSASLAMTTLSVRRLPHSAQRKLQVLHRHIVGKGLQISRRLVVARLAPHQ